MNVPVIDSVTVVQRLLGWQKKQLVLENHMACSLQASKHCKLAVGSVLGPRVLAYPYHGHVS